MRRLAALVFAPLALVGAHLATPAFAADANHMDGVWEGGYDCAQGKTFLRLSLEGDYDGSVRGSFFFSSASWKGGENLTVPDGEYRVQGSLEADGTLNLRGVSWVNQPDGYGMVDLHGKVYTDAEGTWYGGKVWSDACGAFEVKHR